MYKHLGRFTKTNILDYLMQDEQTNAGAISNIQAVGITNKPYYMRSGDHYGFYHTSRLSGVVGLYNNSQCTVYVTDPVVAPEIASFICDYPSHTVFGGAKSMIPVLEYLPESNPYKDVESQYYMLLQHPDMLQEKRPELLFYNAATARNMTPYAVFISRCLKTCFGYDTRVDTILRVLKERGTEEEYLVATLEDTPIAQVHIQALSPHYSQIGGVAVMPEARRQGIGREIVSVMAKRILQRGKTPSLLVDENNTAALNLYHSLGFEIAGEMKVLEY